MGEKPISSFHKKRGPKRHSRWTFWQAGQGPNQLSVMSNADRRKMGVEQDPALPDYQRKSREDKDESKRPSTDRRNS